MSLPPPTDKRAELCELLLGYMRRHPERQDAAEQILRFVTETPDCFERSHAAGHITGSAWLLHPSENKALLTLHRKLGKWLQPGGHADGESHVLQVALREASEESGIEGIRPLSVEVFDVDVHAIPPHLPSGTPQHLHYDVRFLLQAPHDRFAISHESTALAWLDMQQLAELSPAVDDSVLRLARLAWGEGRLFCGGGKDAQQARG